MILACQTRSLAYGHHLLMVAILATTLVLFGCRSPELDRISQPSVALHEAPLLQFRGANSPDTEHPGETDCNSPAHWDGDTLYVFNSAGHPWRSAGSDLFHLNQSYQRTEYDSKANGGRWIDCTWKADDG